MPFVVPDKESDLYPRSVQPAGGSPRDDRDYLAWRDELLANHADLDLAIRWHDAVDDPIPIESWRLDYHLYDTLARDPLFPQPVTPNHRLRFLAVALKTRRSLVLKLANDYINRTITNGVCSSR